MKTVLINPNLIIQRGDPFTTGIVYMPIGLAYAAAALRAAGQEIVVIDAYGEAPFQRRKRGDFLWFGLSEEDILSRIPPDAGLAVVYAANVANHLALLEIIRAGKRTLSSLHLTVLENTQAVTAYALKEVQGEFFSAGADTILTGEGERRLIALAQAVAAGDAGAIAMIDGVGTAGHYNPPAQVETDLDGLPLPAWDLFPLQNYWRLRFAHGPLSTRRYLPLLTSRGCPYPCRFCVIPATNGRKWRGRSAANVVDEMEQAGRQYGVSEFHLEDVDATVSEERTRAVCEEILRRGLKVTWKVGAGTKVETIRSEETIDLMARAGCRYISISPETGSGRLLKAMQKPFDLEHAVRLVQRMHRAGIFSQACFILGYPGETDEDRRATWDLVKEMTRCGVDEIALFIITPVPGAAIYPQMGGYANLSDLTFSPAWREDYPLLNRFRRNLYAHFLMWKLWYHPWKILRQPLNFLRRRFDTKMEMVPYRALVFKLLDWSAGR